VRVVTSLVEQTGEQMDLERKKKKKAVKGHAQIKDLEQFMKSSQYTDIRGHAYIY
jgi:hypothetical protein